MKKTILSLCTLCIAIASFAQKSQEIDWHQYSVGGKNGYYTKHYFFSQKLNAMLESTMGREDGFDGQTMQIEIAEQIFGGAEEKYITMYGDKFAVVIFKNITEDKADVFYYSDTYDKIEDAKAFQPKPEQYTTWYTEKGYALEEAKPTMPELSRNDALEFAKFYAAKATAIQLQMKAIKKTEEQQKMVGLAMAMLLNGVPTEWAVSKGYSGLKSIAVIDKGLKKFKGDKEITAIMKSIKF